MDNNTSKEGSFEFDLESGRISNEEDTSKGIVSGNRQVQNFFSRVTYGLGFNGSIGGECVLNSCGTSGKTSEASEDLGLLMDECSGREESGEHAAIVDKKHMKEKHKKANPKKAAKPPRPPRGPALDASDLKLVKEISELAMKKRSKIERMKVLKKMKAAKSSTSSSNGSLIAVVITILFCLIILFQGICSRNSSRMNFHGSPEPAVATDSLISVQFYGNPSTSDSSGPSSASPNSVENASQPELRLAG